MTEHIDIDRSIGRVYAPFVHRYQLHEPHTPCDAYSVSHLHWTGCCIIGTTIYCAMHCSRARTRQHTKMHFKCNMHDSRIQFHLNVLRTFVVIVAAPLPPLCAISVPGAWFIIFHLVHSRICFLFLCSCWFTHCDINRMWYWSSFFRAHRLLRQYRYLRSDKQKIQWNNITRIHGCICTSYLKTNKIHSNIECGRERESRRERGQNNNPMCIWMPFFLHACVRVYAIWTFCVNGPPLPIGLHIIFSFQREQQKNWNEIKIVAIKFVGGGGGGWPLESIEHSVSTYRNHMVAGGFYINARWTFWVQPRKKNIPI